LRELDEVAFLRFASVYRGFDSLEDFEKEIAKLRADRQDRTSAVAGAGVPEGRSPGLSAGVPGLRSPGFLTSDD
jgi:transcriptional repressor NrdR